MNTFLETLQDAFDGENCLLLVLSKPRKTSGSPLEKVTARPVELQGELRYQFTFRAKTTETHENLSPPEALEEVRRLFGPVFEHCHLYTTQADVTARRKPDGSVKIKRKPPSRQAGAAAHNRVKQYLIPENVPCPFLHEIGVMTRDGRVKRARYAKFRQVNRFLELVDDVLDELPAQGTLHIVDFGCGKSYLTFALHHLLTVVRRREVHLVGLDRNSEVVRDCSRIAEKLNCAGLTFHTGDITDYRAENHVHLAVSLHACDTATDAALAQAVGWSADVILAVPCCQHELAGKIQSGPLRPLLEHGILKERFAALATDALRAKILELCGYRTQVVEFIDMEHTAKNILIRAVRRSEGMENLDNQAEWVESYRKFKELLGVDRMTLEDALGERFPIKVGAQPI